MFHLKVVSNYDIYDREYTISVVGEEKDIFHLWFLLSRTDTNGFSRDGIMITVKNLEDNCIYDPKLGFPMKAKG